MILIASLRQLVKQLHVTKVSEALLPKYSFYYYYVILLRIEIIKTLKT